MRKRKRIGLIVNPLAGIGGRVGLKGSDGSEIQTQALQLGAIPQAGERAVQALRVLAPARDSFDLLSAAGEMGEAEALQCGFYAHVMGASHGKVTTAADTLEAARAMHAEGVDLLLFAGGDGTAQDISRAVGTRQAVLGIPAGVKIHSGVFAVNPHKAGELVLEYLRGRVTGLREAEVIDINEMAYRDGRIATQLYGYLKIPYQPRLVQSQKAPSPSAELVRLGGIAAQVIEEMQPDRFYIMGPGTTTRAIAEALDLPKTLVGVDVISKKGMIALDVSERQLLELIDAQPASIVVTPIGGQGFLFGRGSQPISADVIRKVGRPNILVASLAEKLNELRGRPLLVDSGVSDIDRLLCGYIEVITGYRERVIYRVSD